jgi:hypothetical protein
MGQRRHDEPVRRTYNVSDEVKCLIADLAVHFSKREHRCATKSEVVERAVRALAKKVGVEVAS